MKYPAFVFVLAICISSCQQPQETTEQSSPEAAPSNTSHHSESISKVIQAHGGFENWSKMAHLSYSKGEEKTVTNLWNRKIRLETSEKVIGFDGENVWVAPDSVEVGNARFYHNLYFYFYAMPFVVGDPGAFYEDVEPREIHGKSYNGIKVTYGEGVGDTPDDFYILWYDPETFKMEWLMYTVTFRSGAANEDYRLIKYGDWNEIGGLLLPTAFQWHKFEDGVEGEMTRKVVFENIIVSNEPPSEALFTMPEGAQLAPMPVRN